MRAFFIGAPRVWGQQSLGSRVWRELREFERVWGQGKNYPCFAFGPLLSEVTRLPVKLSTSCLNLSFPNAIP